MKDGSSSAGSDYVNTENMGSDEELRHDSRLCTSKTSLHSFKCAFGTEPFEPNCRYYFEVKLLKGTNFKIGIAESQCRDEPDVAFSDGTKGYAYYSNGQLRHNSKGSGQIYGETFRCKDTIGCYVDLVEGVVFFSKNGLVFGDAFRGDYLMNKTFYPACCCLTKGESFEVLVP